jgi:hypothetical protein
MTPGLETVLHRNDSWWGAPQPYLDEVRLVVVADSVMARQLYQRGELDVVAPPAYTVRSTQYATGAQTGLAANSGWDVRLAFNPAKVDEAGRRALVAAVERRLFVDTLLSGEAVVLDDWVRGGSTWATVQPGESGALKGKGVQLTGAVEEPMTSNLQRAVQKRVNRAGGSVELRNAEQDRVDGWVAAGDFEAALVMAYEGPEMCWTCRWASVDAGLAAAADGGDASARSALEAKLRDGAFVLPLWRPVPFLAAQHVNGAVVNGYGLNGAWNAWEWWR